MSGRPLVYLDSAATTQRARDAVQAMDELFARRNANIHQEGFALAREAKSMADEGRATLATFIGARRPEEVVHVDGSTEGINLVMTTWGLDNLRRSHNIVLTTQEHLSNLLPWQILSKRTGCELRFIESDDTGKLRLEQLSSVITRRTKLVALPHVSNVLGHINPVDAVVERAREVGARVLVDGAQSTPHIPIDVRALGCDFFVFSGHKMLGPFGSSVMWARHELLEEMTPYNAGGGSVEKATLKRAEYKDPPQKFEGGTDNPAGTVGLAAAVKLLRDTGERRIMDYERRLTEHGLERLMNVPKLRLIGSFLPEDRLPIFSFVIDGYTGSELATKLGNRGIAVSGGSLNAGPCLAQFGLEEATRASCYVYNTLEELDVLAEALTELSAEAGRR